MSEEAVGLSYEEAIDDPFVRVYSIEFSGQETGCRELRKEL